MRLDRRLVLEEAERLPDGLGGAVQRWLALGTLWARIEAGAGRERAGAFVTLSAVPYRIVVRAAPIGAPSRPRPDQRFREGARLFRILAVSEGAPGYLVCQAQEEVAA